MNRVDASLIAGGAATALTLSMPLWPESVLAPIAGFPLGFGILFAAAFYGGPHNAPADVPFFIFASIVNGVFWICVVRTVCWLRDLVRAVRS